MGIRDLFKKPNVNKNIENIFEKMDQGLQGKKLVNQAISYRNLKQYDKAISILEESIRKYPNYTPARVVLGNTMRKKGDIEGAEKQFKKMLSDYSDGKEYPLTEIYANLASLYYFERKDKEKALKCYELALKAPRPEMVDNKEYEPVLSNLYKELCMVHLSENNFELALKYADKRLDIDKDCPIASRVMGTCLLHKYMDHGKIIKYIIDDIEPRDLISSANNFQNCFREDPRDYYALLGISLSLTYYGIWAAKNNHQIEDKISKANTYYLEKLGAYAKESEVAKEMYEQYTKTISDMGKMLISEMAQ